MRLKHNIKYMFLCCDLNLQNSRDIDGVTGDVIHGEASPKMEARKLVFIMLLRDNVMCVANTLRDNSIFLKSVTLVFLGEVTMKVRDLRFKIDYISTSENVVCEDINTKGGRRVKSNHIPISGSFVSSSW